MKNFQIAGRVGSNPELKKSGETHYIDINVATRTRTEDPDWFTITFFGKQAEVVAQFVYQGMAIAVSGELRMNKYEGRQTVQLIGKEIDFLSSKRKGEED